MLKPTRADDRLVRAAWALLRQRPALLVFPTLSGLGTLALQVPVVLNMTALLGNRANPDWAVRLMLLTIPITAIWMLLAMTLSNACNVALIMASDRALRRQPPSATTAAGAALLRLPSIVGWSGLHALAELSRGHGLVKGWPTPISSLGRQSTAFMARIGIEWTDALHLVTPVLALERTGPLEAARRSQDLVRRCWGTDAVAAPLFPTAGPLVVLASVMLVVLGVAHGITTGAATSLQTVLPVAFGLVLAPASLIITSALRAIMRAILYRYAVDGALPPGIDAATMSHAMVGGRAPRQTAEPEPT